MGYKKTWISPKEEFLRTKVRDLKPRSMSRFTVNNEKPLSFGSVVLVLSTDSGRRGGGVVPLLLTVKWDV